MERLIPQMIAESKKEQVNEELRLFKPSIVSQPPTTDDFGGDVGVYIAECLGKSVIDKTINEITRETLNEYESERIKTTPVTQKLNRAFEVLKQQGIELSEQEKQMEIDYYNQKTQFVNEQEVLNMINVAFNNRIRYEKSKQQEQYMGMSM